MGAGKGEEGKGREEGRVAMDPTKFGRKLTPMRHL